MIKFIKSRRARVARRESAAFATALMWDHCKKIVSIPGNTEWAVAQGVIEWEEGGGGQRRDRFPMNSHQGFAFEHGHPQVALFKEEREREREREMHFWRMARSQHSRWRLQSAPKRNWRERERERGERWMRGK